MDTKNVKELLDELEELVEKGNAIPFSSKAMIDPVEFTEIIDELREALPAELAEAKKIVAEKKRILYEAQQEADELKSNVKNQMKQLVNEDQYVVESKSRGDNLINAAKKQAQEITMGTHRYADKILYELQLQLRDLNEQIENNRKELKGNAPQQV